MKTFKSSFFYMFILGAIINFKLLEIAFYGENPLKVNSKVVI